MTAFTLVVFAKPVEGREEEFNDWYTNRHLKDVLAIPGFRSVRRLRQVQAVSGDLPQYCALYEIEADDAAPIVERLLSASQEDMPISPALDPDTTAVVFEVFASRANP